MTTTMTLAHTLGKSGTIGNAIRCCICVPLRLRRLEPAVPVLRCHVAQRRRATADKHVAIVRRHLLYRQRIRCRASKPYSVRLRDDCRFHGRWGPWELLVHPAACAAKRTASHRKIRWQTCILPYAARRMLHKLDARAGSPSAIRYHGGFPNPSTLESANAIGTCSDSDDPSIASLAPHAGQRTGF